VLARIREEGPLSTGDFEREHGATKDWFGMPENVVRAVLESLTVQSVIGLAHRDGTSATTTSSSGWCRRTCSRTMCRAVNSSCTRSCRGIAPTACWGAGGAGGTFDRVAEPTVRNDLRKELVEQGRLVPVDVEGVRAKRLVVAAELALLEAPPEPPPSVAFIAPFDSLLWDTGLLASLFGFEYVWEGFFKPEKRRWGCYVLSILFGDRLVGWIEPRIDRDGARVEVLGLWWEDGFAPRRAAGFVDAMRDALRAYLRFADADHVEWALELAAEKRLFLARRDRVAQRR
jgi:uncharacterized protein